MDWQPIETSPKDGTWFLASNGGLIPFVTCWNSEDDRWFTFNGHFENTIQKYSGKPWQPVCWWDFGDGLPLPPPPTPTDVTASAERREG